MANTCHLHKFETFHLGKLLVHLYEWKRMFEWAKKRYKCLSGARREFDRTGFLRQDTFTLGQIYSLLKSFENTS